MSGIRVLYNKNLNVLKNASHPLILSKKYLNKRSSDMKNLILSSKVKLTGICL